ncbi:MAG: hypothetical protein K2Z81_14080 [Cyanobacteria bacterium]|nr:hypothetical protein [Cyanobacteriota bacterium]
MVPANGSNIDEGEIRGWLRDRLERHKLPRTIQVVEGIPRNQLGKIDRRALSGL